MKSHSRRRFLRVASEVALSGAVVSGCSGNQDVGPAPIGDVSVGNIADLPNPSLQAVGSTPVAVGRDDQGVYAFTLTCPHEGCNMATDGTVGSGGVFCGCHGSRFDPNGKVTRGPANSSLTHFAVEVDANGEVTIHGDQEVSSGTRTTIA